MSKGALEPETFKEGLDEALIASMMIQEDMSEQEHLKSFAESDLPIRRLIAAKQLPSAIHHFDYESAIQIIIPMLNDMKVDKIANIRQHLSDSIYGVSEFFLKFHSEPSEFFGWEITQFILPVLFSCLTDQMLPVRIGSMHSLIKIAKLMGAGYTEINIIPTLDRYVREGNEDTVTISIDTLSHISQLLSPDSCQRLIVNPIIAALKNSTFRIRKTIATSLERLSSAVGYQVSTIVLLPIFLRLSKDEIWGIRKACGEAIVGFAKNLPVDKAAAFLLPVMSGFLVDFSRWVRFSASENLGPFLYHLGVAFLDEQLLRHYLSMSKTPDLGYGDPEASFYCAYSFSAILNMLGQERWKDVQPTFDLLVKDLQVRVRKCIAASLPSIAQTIGPSLTKMFITPIFLKYLTDCDEVKESAIFRLHDFFRLISKDERVAFFGILPKVIGDTGNQWRMRKSIVGQLASLCDICDLGEITDFIMPLFFSLATDRIYRVRSLACDKIWLVYKRMKEEKCSFVSHFIESIDRLKLSRNLWKRQSCVMVCVGLLLEYPSDADHIWNGAISTLCDDKVTDVRMVCCTSLVRLSHHKSTPQEYWNPLLQKLCNDPISSIQSIARAALTNQSISQSDASLETKMIPQTSLQVTQENSSKEIPETHTDTDQTSLSSFGQESDPSCAGSS